MTHAIHGTWAAPRSTQALNSEQVREGMIDILLNHTNRYEDLRDQGLQE